MLLQYFASVPDLPGQTDGPAIYLHHQNDRKNQKWPQFDPLGQRARNDRGRCGAEHQLEEEI